MMIQGYEAGGEFSKTHLNSYSPRLKKYDAGHDAHH